MVLIRTAVSDKIRIASTSKITKETRAVTAKIKVRKAASPRVRTTKANKCSKAASAGTRTADMARASSPRLRAGLARTRARVRVLPQGAHRGLASHNSLMR